MLLIAKIAVSAVFVLGVTAAAERLGPRLGAINLVGSLALVGLGLAPALMLAYAVDIAYLVLVVRVSRRRQR